MRLSVIAALAIFMTVALSGRATAAVYACDVKEVRHLGADGVPQGNDRTALTHRRHPHFTFDDRTGRLSGLKDDWVLSLLQKAVAENALLAVSVHKGTGNTGLRILKIDTFRDDAMPFVWISDDEISTGVCRSGTE